MKRVPCLQSVNRGVLHCRATLRVHRHRYGDGDETKTSVNADTTADTDPVPTTLFRYVLVSIIIINLSVGAVVFYPAPPVDSHQTGLLTDAIETVPADATLLVQNDIYPHVAHREDASFVSSIKKFERYQRRHGTPIPEYIIMDTRSESHGLNWAQTILTGYGSRLFTLYGVQNYTDGVWVLRRGYDGSVLGVGDRAFTVNRTYTPADLSTDAARLDARHDGVVARQHGSGYLWYGPYATLPPGNYMVAVRLNVRQTAPNDAVRVEVVAGSDHRMVADAHVNDTTGWTTVRLDIELARARQNVEFRVWGSDGATVRLKTINLHLMPRKRYAADGGT